MHFLQGRKVLLLAPRFYGYENEIIAKLVELGAEVTYLNDDPSESWTICAGSLIRFGISINKMIRHFENRIIRSIGKNKYDIVLVINGQRITSYATHLIREKHLNKDGQMVLYFWDSIDNLKDDTSRWADFDRICTFDNVDYEKHKNTMFFLPLFYCDKYWIKDHQATKYDVMIIGSFRLNRYLFVKDLETRNPDVVVGSYLYHSKLGFVFHKTFRKKYNHVKYDDLRYKKLSFQDVVDLYKNSNAIIDIPMPGQRGLTIRTIEALAMHKKLITTNDNIKQYNFYNTNDFFVLSPKSVTLPNKEWFNTSYSLHDEIIKEYSIESWINKLLDYENRK